MKHSLPPKGRYAWTVKIGEKGQFVIPKEARDLFDFQPGDTLVVLADHKKGIAIPPKPAFSKLMERIFDHTPDEDDPGEENGKVNGN